MCMYVQVIFSTNMKTVLKSINKREKRADGEKEESDKTKETKNAVTSNCNKGYCCKMISSFLIFVLRLENALLADFINILLPHKIFNFILKTCKLWMS